MGVGKDDTGFVYLRSRIRGPAQEIGIQGHAGVEFAQMVTP